MPDPTAFRVLLIAVAVGAIVLRVLAFRNAARRGSTLVATIALFAVLVLVLGLFVWSMVGAYIGAVGN